MTAACREPCCSVQPRLSISELFDRGYRRNRSRALSIEGTCHVDAEGNTACFSLDAADGRIVGIGFRATTCATLIALRSGGTRAVTSARCNGGSSGLV